MKTELGKYKKGDFKMGNGEKTPMGVIFGVLAAILVIVSIVISIATDISLLSMF